MRTIFFILSFLTLFNVGGIARPNGAPCDVLISMTPAQAAHGDPSLQESPYVIEFLNPDTQSEPECYRADKNYLVRIRSTDGSSFAGFILQCRDYNDNRFGTFVSDSGNRNMWQYQCRKTDSITHVKANRKENIDVIWRPNGYTGEFNCKATVLQSMYVWWAKIPSRTLVPCVGEGGPPNVPFADPAAPAVQPDPSPAQQPSPVVQAGPVVPVRLHRLQFADGTSSK